MTFRFAPRLSRAILSLGLAASGCAGLSRPPAGIPVSPVRVTTGRVLLRGEPFEIHLAQPAAPRRPDVLVLYASGDGGWFGSAADMFEAIGANGFCAVGLSSRGLLRHKLSGGRAPTVSELADDYRTIVDHAAAALHLPADYRVVLTGWSRGASLAVLTGESRHAMPSLAGVIAIGLTEDENLGVAGDTDDDPDDPPAARSESSVALYPLLAQIAPRRVAVIQASGDGYLRASRARELFGTDTESRRFFDVTARNHRFGGGTQAFALALRAALEWVVE
ncbi:MAG: AcvB/VirJ family lysyl-phosphatidylglycerol hydrolase [Vicinamibacterales bacterium]